MKLEQGLFDYEVFCEICGSNKCTVEYDVDENCLNVKCLQCGAADRVFLLEEEYE